MTRRTDPPAAQTSEPLAADDFRELARLNHSGTHTCAGACLAEVVAAFEAAAPASPDVMAALRSHEPEPQFVGGRWDCSCGWHAENANAQMWWDHLAAALPAAPAGLDVERLAEALVACEAYCCEGCVLDIAAEYARLAQQDGTEK